MYRIHSLVVTLAFAVAFLVGGCESDLVGPTDAPADNPEAALQVDATPAAAKSEKAAKPGPMIWANGELFRSIVTSATFSGDQGNFDALYVLDPAGTNGNTFAGDYTHLSDSAPGDQDYNGGRWEVFHLKSSVDAGKYDDVSSTSDAAFDHTDWVSQEVYFECPMLPMRGQGHN